MNVDVRYVDEHDERSMSQRKRFWDEYSGLLVAPLALFPGWRKAPGHAELVKDRAARYNQAIITLVNEIAAAREIGGSRW